MNIFETYPGGKNINGTYQKIINEIPPHVVYFEPFVGGGSILRKKKHALHSSINDVDPIVMTQWKSHKMEGLRLTTGNALELIPSVRDGIDAGNALQSIGNIPEGIDTEVFMYLDPPYPIKSRTTTKDLYNYQLSDKDHASLLDIILTVNFNCMISTYPNELYEKKLQRWRRIEFKSKTRGYVATEVLYMNYEEPRELHDYQYLGDECWERQGIKRKIERHVQKLSKLPILEQRAILIELNKNLNLK